MPLQHTPVIDKKLSPDGLKWIPDYTVPAPVTTCVNENPATTTITTTTSTIMAKKVKDSTPKPKQYSNLDSLIEEHGSDKLECSLVAKAVIPEIDKDDKLFIEFVNGTLSSLVKKVDVLEWADEANCSFTILVERFGIEGVQKYLEYLNFKKFKEQKQYWLKLLQGTEYFTFDGTTVQIKPADLDNLPMFCFKLLNDFRLQMTKRNQATVVKKIINWSPDEEETPLPIVDEDVDPYPGKDFNYRVSQEPSKYHFQKETKKLGAKRKKFDEILKDLRRYTECPELADPEECATPMDSLKSYYKDLRRIRTEATKGFMNIPEHKIPT